jgi:hypothetical protein
MSGLSGTAIPSPVRLRNHRFLVLREPYLELCGGDLWEALLLYWLEMQTRWALEEVSQREGAPAADDLRRAIEQGHRDERMWIRRSLREVASRDFAGAISHGKLKRVRDALVEAGYCEYEEGEPATNVPSRWRLRVAALQDAVDGHGYGREPLAALDPAEPDGEPDAVPTTPGSQMTQGGSQMTQVLGDQRPRPGSRVTQAWVTHDPPIDRGSTSTEQENTGEKLAPLPRIATTVSRQVVQRSGFPAALRGIAVDELVAPSPGHEAALDAARRFAAAELNGLLLHGAEGRGKTVLAAAAAWGRVASGKGVAWLIASAAAEAIATRFTDNPERESVLERLKRAGGLVLDDLQTVKRRDVKGAFQAAIENRIQAGSPVIVTTRLSIEQLRRSYGSRLFGYCEVHQVAGPDLNLWVRERSAA